jgi:6-phosphogluconolactonase (cycloisomerase 2 family)
MNIEFASRTAPRSLVADDHVMSAEALRGLSCRWRTLVILGIVTIVLLAGCGGGAGKSVGNQPPPTTPAITTISPKTAVADGAAFTLTINGANFVAASTVNFGGSAPVTTFVNSMQLTAAIPAASIASTGTMAVTVTNPAPGGTSNAITFTITGGGPNSVPMITSFYPSCAPAGEQFIDSTDNQLTVSGQNFVASSVVRWNGTDVPTTLDSNSLGQVLTAQIPASDIASPGTAAVTVFNPAPGGGTSNSLTFTTTPGAVDPQSVAVNPAGNFAYVASQGCSSGVGGYVSMYTINPTTGALTSIGPPVSTNDVGTDSVTIDPFGKFAYVANEGLYATDGSVSAYSIDPTTGALTSTSGGISGNSPEFCCFTAVAVHPSDKFAYVANGDSTPRSVSVYTINGANGALTYFGTIAAEGFPTSVVVDPSGQFVYVAAETDSGTPGPGSVSMYAINVTTGALTSLGTIATGTMIAESSSNSIVVDPTGAFAYVTNSGSNNVSMYSINATTGVLTSGGLIDAGTTPLSVAVDPTGKFAYVTNFSSNDISMYTINATTGALTPVGTIATEQSPTSIAIHPSGKFAYVTNSASNSVSMYSIDGATGTLTLIGTIGT